MNVCIVIHNLPLAKDTRVGLEARALRQAGFGVTVVCPGPPGHHVVDGIDVYQYRPAPATGGTLSYICEFGYGLVRTALLLARVQRRHHIDVLQACNPPDTYWLLALPLKLLGVRFVFDQHDLCPETYRSRFTRNHPVLDRMLLWLERRTYRTADHVVVTNESYRRIALHRGGLSPDEVTVVRTGPDTDRLRPGPPHPELRRGREHLLVYVGIMGPQDGVDIAVRAVDELVHRLGRRDVAVALLGSGDCWDSLRALVDELDLGDHVAMPGHVGREELSAYLSTAAIGLCPDPSSPLNDVSTTIKTMEYMAFGLPIVSFDLAATRVSAGDAGLYVTDDDPAAFGRGIAELLEDPERRRRMGTAGRQRVEGVLAWKYQVDGYLDVFRSLDRSAPADGPGTGGAWPVADAGAQEEPGPAVLAPVAADAAADPRRTGDSPA